MECSQKNWGVKERDKSHDPTPAVLILSRHAHTHTLEIPFHNDSNKDDDSHTFVHSFHTFYSVFVPMFVNTSVIVLCFINNTNVEVW